MAREQTTNDANKPSADIEALKKRHKQIETERTTAQANLANATRQLAELKEEAMKSYGTDDLDALRARLKQMREENESKRAAYQAHLEEVEARLAQVNQKFNEPR